MSERRHTYFKDHSSSEFERGNHLLSFAEDHKHRFGGEAAIAVLCFFAGPSIFSTLGLSMELTVSLLGVAISVLACELVYARRVKILKPLLLVKDLELKNAEAATTYEKNINLLKNAHRREVKMLMESLSSWKGTDENQSAMGLIKGHCVALTHDQLPVMQDMIEQITCEEEASRMFEKAYNRIKASRGLSEAVCVNGMETWKYDLSIIERKGAERAAMWNCLVRLAVAFDNMSPEEKTSSEFVKVLVHNRDCILRIASVVNPVVTYHEETETEKGGRPHSVGSSAPRFSFNSPPGSPDLEEGPTRRHTVTANNAEAAEGFSGTELIGRDKAVRVRGSTITRVESSLDLGVMTDWGRWCLPEYERFRVRGPTYLADKVKIPAGHFKTDVVHIELWTVSKRIGNITARTDNYVHEFQSKFSHPPFMFVVNFMVPGPPDMNLVAYFALKESPEDDHFGRILKEFVTGTDQFRNSRFKIIPNVVEGNWIVKKGVGSTPAILGKKLTTHYYRGNGYIEVSIDVGSSSVAGSILKLVKGQAKNLVIDLSFLIEAQTQRELPEELLAGMRLGNCNLSKAVPLE